jgi:hypothetical protein
LLYSDTRKSLAKVFDDGLAVIWRPERMADIASRADQRIKPEPDE